MRAASASQSVAPIFVCGDCEGHDEGEGRGGDQGLSGALPGIVQCGSGGRGVTGRGRGRGGEGRRLCRRSEAPAAPSLPFAEAAFLKPARCIFDVANAPEVASTESLGCASEESPRLGRENTPEKRVVMQEECQLRAKFFRRRSSTLGTEKKNAAVSQTFHSKKKKKKQKTREFE